MSSSIDAKTRGDATGSGDTMARGDAVARTGVRLLIDIVRREWWDLLVLNLLFILATLPIVTIGPALVALARITLRMVQDRPVDLWHDFRTAFLTNFRQGMLAGITLAAAGFATGWLSVFFLLNLGHGILMFLMLAAALSATLVVLLAGSYVFAQIATVRLPFPTILNNAILLGVSDPKRTLPALLASAALAALPFLYPPIAPLIFLIVFSASSLFASLAVWPGIRDHVVADGKS